MYADIRRPRPVFTIAAVLACAGLASTSAAQAPTEFRINAGDPILGKPALPPSIGLVWGGSGVAGNTTDAMAFSWQNTLIEPVAVPLCPPRVCGGREFYDVFGAAPTLPTSLFARRFSVTGAPLDAGDVLITSTTPLVDGPTQAPVVSMRKINTGVGRVNPWRINWWNQWSWVTPGGPTPIACDNQPVGVWRVGYADFNSTAPSTGSALLLQPARRPAYIPSATWSGFNHAAVWRDLTTSCRQILLASNDNYTTPIIIAEGTPGDDSSPSAVPDRPCIDSNINEQFVIVWREDDDLDPPQSIRARRWSPITGLGPVINVAENAADNAAPSVAVLDDGSFIVQWTTWSNGDPPLLSLVAQRFDEQLLALPYGDQAVIVEGNSFSPSAPAVHHTISARGQSVRPSLTSLATASSVYQLDAFETGSDVYARRLVLSSDTALPVGPETYVPLTAAATTESRLGEAQQHGALVRSDFQTAVAWHNAQDGNVYCTIRTLPLPILACGPSDIAGPNQSDGSDGSLSADDIIVYLSWFFAGDSRADIAGPNQSEGGDGSFTADDIIVFLSRYFAGC